MIEEPDIMESTAEPDYGIEFPISLYDRPMLAMSNLLLRGDVDAATRSIFTPDTLTPTELETLRRRIAGPKPNSVVRTVLDVATNPLVIAGLVGGYLVWPAAGAAGLAELYAGLRKAPVAGLMSRWVGASFTRLRHLPGMHLAIADLNKEVMNFAARWHDRLAEAYGKVPGVAKGGAQGHRMAFEMSGWSKPGSLLQKVRGMSDAPIAPGLQGKMTAEEIGAAAKTRNVSNALWAEAMKDPATVKELEAAAKARGLTLGEFRDSYFPKHITPNEYQRAIKRNMAPWKPTDPLSMNLIEETGTSIPDPVALRAAEARGEVRAGFTDELLANVEAQVETFHQKLQGTVAQAVQSGDPSAALKAGIGKLLAGRQNSEWLADAASQRIYAAKMGVGGDTVQDATAWAARMIEYPATYSLDFDPAWTRYVGRMAPTYGWHVAGHGKKIHGMMDQFRATGQLDDATDKYLNNQLIPMMVGKRTAKQMARASMWSEWRLARAKWLETSTAAKFIPQDARQWLAKNLKDLSGVDVETVGHGINEYLYLSTMGMNLGPPGKNIWQNPLTFVNLPGMGWGAWGKGMVETFERGMKYIGDVMNKVPPEKAFRNRFSDFIDVMGPNAGIIERLFGTETPYARMAAGKPGLVRRFEAAAMAPFKFSELWVNRMPAFYGAKSRALAGGMEEAAANRTAATIVDLSHFTGGPMSMPSGIMDTWAPWRQFLQFPLRFVDFVAGSTRMGKDAARLDLGTISRSLAASATAYTVGRDIFHTDLAQGLILGALPLPQYENSPFYPMPLVPPIVQMAGNVVQGIAMGKSQPVLDTATLMVPGGLAIRRLYRTLGPKRADYANRTPDGRIPVYNDQGGLIGAYTPLQLSLRAVGIMPGNAAAERGAAEWLVTQRDQIRGYRKKWLDAMMANDPAEQDRIQQEFQARYPELGPMQVKKTDIDAIRTRREVTRVNRILRGFPRAYKPLFENIVGEAELGAFTQNLPAVQSPMALAG